MAVSVTIDGKIIGRLTQQFSTFHEVAEWFGAECERRNKTLNVTITIPAVPEWGLPQGGTYHCVAGPSGVGDEEYWYSLNYVGP